MRAYVNVCCCHINLGNPGPHKGWPRKQNTKSRIVGGYAPKVRPWMALFELEHPRRRKNKRHATQKKNSQCGGAIINKVK